MIDAVTWGGGSEGLRPPRRQGGARAYAIPAPELEGQLGVEPEGGQSVTEIDVPELDRISEPRDHLHMSVIKD